MIKFQKTTIFEALGRNPVHPFPARMAPGIALQIMSDIDESRVLDPMMGSGTVLAMARAQGHHGIGFDIDPLAVLISKVWTIALDPEDIRGQATSVLENAVNEFKHIAVADAYPQRADDETCQFVRYWFDGYARRQLTALSFAIRSLKSEISRDALWCAFSRLIISKQSGASRAMDLSHSRPHRVFDTAPEKPFNKFLSAVERVIASGIDRSNPERGFEPVIKMGDARELALPNQTVDLVLTSPPYLNAIDYIRCSKFSLIWMGYSIAQLRGLRTNSIGSEAARNPCFDDSEINRIMDALSVRHGMAPRYQRVLERYIVDMRSAIHEVARVLRRAGKAVYVVGENTLRGTFIRTSLIVLKLAEASGLSLRERWVRTLPANRRYMPPPSSDYLVGTMNSRMTREVVLTFIKE